DVSAEELERRIRHDAFGRRRQRLLVQARHDLHEAADRRDDQDAEDQEARAALDPLVQIQQVHAPDSAASAPAGGATRTVSIPAIVRHRLTAISTAPARNSPPATSRSA